LSLPRYSVVVPVFNEELVIRETYTRLRKVMESLGEPYELIFVNDGSTDRSQEIITEICRQDPRVKLINFSRNFGHQIAITAGMDHASGEAVIVIDADLQDPPEVIPSMVAKWKEGYEVVYGKRIKRKGEGFFKKFTAALFYRLLQRMTNLPIPVDVGDFRLLDRKVCQVLKDIREKNRYVRGLVSWVGFKQAAVEYVRDPRFAGETKYSLKKMLKLAWDGLTSFSHLPLEISLKVGGILALGGMAYLLVVLLVRPAPASLWGNVLLSAMIFLTGVNLFFLGLLGIYVARIYDEARNRPLYIIASRVGFDENRT